MSQTKANRAIFNCLTALLFSAQSAQAESSQSLLSRVFQTGDYDALENLAAEKIRSNVQDSVAHFYMGVAYYKQKRLNLAGPEFREVLKYSSSAEEVRRARQYLSAISAESAPAPTKITTSATPATGAPASTGNKGLDERIKFLREQAKSKKASASQRFDTEVKQIRAREGKDISTGGTNPETQKQINEAFARMSKYESDIDKELDQQIADLSRPNSNSRGETRVSTGAGGLVKNYEHLGDESEAVNIPSENALSAKAQSMKASKKK